MSRYIGTYCCTCNMCLCTKKDRHTPVGHLQLLAIPQHPWQIVSVDFIMELPEANGYDVVMVAVDTRETCAFYRDTYYNHRKQCRAIIPQPHLETTRTP
jgi:hypothetical protein